MEGATKIQESEAELCPKSVLFWGLKGSIGLFGVFIGPALWCEEPRDEIHFYWSVQ